MLDIGEGFVFADEQEAQAACEWWQWGLRMQDWLCDVMIVRAHKFVDPHNQAELDCNVDHKTATIRLKDPIDFHPQDGNVFDKLDHEACLVHELGHLLFYPEESERSLEHEQALNMFCDSAVRLRRLAYPEPPWRAQ